MIRLYNTLSKRVEDFVPLEADRVRMYTCGPTVHDHPHIGNFRTFIWEDLLRRTLELGGYQVTQVMNLTDVDDKTIRKSQEKGVTLAEYTEPYVRSFFEGLDVLRVKRAEFYPRATDHIPEMIRMIETLRDKGVTYVSQGSLYFRIGAFPDYGRLSGVERRELLDGARIDSDEYEKESARDFVLWKARKENEPYWDSPFGPGRPGWHIECSAMSFKYLGETFDIHTGGVDNIFPHHENEIAQSEACSGKPFVRYWLHAAHLLVDSGKMSKSLGNFFTLREILDKGVDPRAVRWLLLGTHYRRNLNFSFDGLSQAAREIGRLEDFRTRLEEAAAGATTGPLTAGERDGSGIADPADRTHREGGPSGSSSPVDRIVGGANGSGGPSPVARSIASSVEEFGSSLTDDLNISSALGAVFRMVRDTNAALDRGEANAADIAAARKALAGFDEILQVLRKEGAVLDEDVEGLIRRREEARKARNFAESDRIRQELASQGIVLEDTPHGVRWKRR